MDVKQLNHNTMKLTETQKQRIRELAPDYTHYEIQRKMNLGYYEVITFLKSEGIQAKVKRVIVRRNSDEVQKPKAPSKMFNVDDYLGYKLVVG